MDIEEKLLDHELVSIEDYSVRAHIDPELYKSVVSRQEKPELYQDFGEDIEQQQRWDVPIRKFKRYLIDKI
jgi:hypothetical protein